MKERINSRLVGIAILTTIITAISITFVYYHLFEIQIRRDLAVSAKLLKDTHYFESVNDDVDEIDLSTGIDELRVTWIDSDGTVLYDNDTNAVLLSNHNDRPEIQEAFQNGVADTVRKSDTMNKSTFYYAVLLDNGTVLRVATDAESLLSVFVSVAPIIALVLLFIFTACIILSNLLTKQLLRPIELMAENLDDPDYESPYTELEPFSRKLRVQHEDILSAAKARQDFTANVSHELKTPLTAISGYAELLENDMVDTNRQKEFYADIKKNSDRLISLINDIIRLSEIDHKGAGFEFDEVDLFSLCKDTASFLAVSAAQKKVSLTCEGVPCIINGSRELLKELIENLIQNAIRYNNPGGKVLVSVNKRKNQTVLMVKDNGIGIPASEQSRIFERFYRVDKSRSKETGGTGLGLAIVKHIVDIHGAQIEVDSAPGVGTSMTVIF